MNQNWIQLPHPQHFCGARDCQFRLATVVAMGKYIVSTIGEYFPRHAKERQTIGGFGINYETMVFLAKANDRPGEGCCPFLVSDFMNLDFLGYAESEEASNGHWELCEKWDVK